MGVESLDNEIASHHKVDAESAFAVKAETFSASTEEFGSPVKHTTDTHSIPTPDSHSVPTPNNDEISTERKEASTEGERRERTSIAYGTPITEIPLGSCFGFVRDMPTLLGVKQFMHMGVYLGDGTRVKRDLQVEKAHDDIDIKDNEHYVIHLWHPDHKEHAQVRIDAVSRVGEGTPIVAVEVPHLKPGALQEIETRAFSRLGEPGFNMVFKSCQQYATWARYGDRINLQAEGAIKGLLAPTVALGGLALGVMLTPFVPFAVAAYTACGLAGTAGAIYISSPVHHNMFVKNMTLTPIDYSTPLRERQTMSEQLC